MENFKDINNFLNEKRVTVKRRYTESHPAKNVSTEARVRSAILDAIADGNITEDEMGRILTELKAHKRWLSRNKGLFNISEDQAGIRTYTLSPYGNRIRTATRPSVINEALTVPHKEKGKKPVNIFVGRFQPFTLGHVKVFEKMYRENGLPVVVYMVRGGKADPEKRPFDEDVQQAMFSKMQKQYPFLEASVVVPNGAIDTLFSNARPTYEPMMWGYGTDRKNAYNGMIDKQSYRDQLDVHPDFKGYEIKRSADNISASKVRNALQIDDEKTFKKMTPKSIHGFYKPLQTLMQPIKENDKMDNLKTLNEFNSKITEGNLNEGLDPYQILYIFKSLIEKGGSVGVTQKGEWEKRGTHVPTAEEIKEVALKHLKYKRINRSVIDDVIDEWEVFKKDEKLDKLYKKKSSWVKNDIKESNLDEGKVTEEYVESMDSIEIANLLGKIKNLWDAWKGGPMTEPSDIKPAQKELKGWIDRWFKKEIK